MSTFVNVGGTFREAANIYYKSGGEWRTIQNAWIKSGGEWRSIFESVKYSYPLGSSIGGTGQTGNMVATNAAGDIIAVSSPTEIGPNNGGGVVRVYGWNGSSWVQRGGDLNATTAGYTTFGTGDYFGNSIALNSSGLTIVIGAPYSDNSGADVGSVVVFDYNGTSWVRRGNPFMGLIWTYGWAGAAVAISANGNTVVFSKPRDDYYYTNSGSVLAFRWSGSSWVSDNVEALAYGIATSDQIGSTPQSLAINNDGTIIAIGAPSSSVTASLGGQVRFYSKIGGATNWTQMGVIVPDGTFQSIGASVAFNNAGTRVAITGSFGVRVYFYDVSTSTWVQLGATIGTGSSSVSMNGDGNKIAVASAANSKVYIYAWNEVEWRLLLTCSSANASFGSSVALSDVGDRVVIGSPTSNQAEVRSIADVSPMGTTSIALSSYNASISMNADGNRIVVGETQKDIAYVLSWSGKEWTQMGSNINGEYASSTFGAAVAINDAGDRIIVAAPLNSPTGNFSDFSKGSVRIYSWNGTSWNQLGQSLYGEASFNYFGESVAMNAAGDVVAVGADSNDGSASNAGHVRIFVLNGGTWVQRGIDIDGPTADARFGTSVALNDAGDRVIIGGSNVARVYSWNGTAWNTLGSVFTPPVGNTQIFGAKVAINGEGNRIAITAPNSYSSSGKIYAYSLSGSTWTTMGSVLTAVVGDTVDLFGNSLSMNRAGDRIIAGATSSDVGGTDTGRVLIFAWNGTNWVKMWNTINGTTANGRLGTDVAMNAVGDKIAITSTSFLQPYNIVKI